MNKQIKYLLAALILMIWGCNDSKLSNQTNCNEEDSNFILYVSNQSFEISPVDIKILIDSNLVVDQKFRVLNQHNWKKFCIQLNEGSHIIEVTSKKGGAQLKKKFEITKKTWGSVDYWYYPKKDKTNPYTPKSFEFELKNKPIIFI